MITGTGRLNLCDGRGIDVLYQFAGEYDDRGAGYLLFDTVQLDDARFALGWSSTAMTAHQWCSWS